MKLQGKIEVNPGPKDHFLIISFRKDKKRQHFQIWLDKEVGNRLKAGSCYIFNVKYRSIVMPDVSGNLTYETQLYQEGFLVPLPDSYYWE